MISAALPGFLVAAGLFAAVPFGLHFLTRRPPEREALPTARFLTEDPRTLLRLRRRPTDLLLLGVRVAFALALGAAFAGLTWTPARSGAARVVLVDGGADAGTAWSTTVEAVDAAVVGAAESGAAGSGDDVRVVVYGLDDGWRAVDEESLPQLTRGARPATVQDGLRALRAFVGTEPLAEVEAVWVGRPSWHAWSPGLGLMRERLWPGRLAMRPVGAAAVGGSASAGGSEAEGAPTAGGAVDSEGTSLTPVAWISGAVRGDGSLGRALAALGAEVSTAPDASGDGDADATPAEAGVPSTEAGSPSDDADWIFASAADAPGPLLDRARSGATLVLAGPLEATGGDDVPWSIHPAAEESRGVAGPVADTTPGIAPTPEERPATAGPGAGGVGPLPALVVLPGDRAVGAPVTRMPGAPAAGSHTLAVFDDGTPAVAARPLGSGCVVYAAVPLGAPALTASVEYPSLVERLATGCDADGSDDVPLDGGALAVLERPDLPATVDVADLMAAAGVPLGRWLVLLALVLLGVEILMTRERRS